MEMVCTLWLDDERPTPDDPKAMRSKLVAMQDNAYTCEDVAQATPPIKTAE